MKVLVGNRRVTLDPSSAIGKGGEADVYDLGDGRALKIFKGPTHPDLRHSPAEQRLAKDRLATHQHKLRAFPGGLPDRVVAPGELALCTRGTTVVGYAMPLVVGADPLHRFADARFRSQAGVANRALAALRDLHLTLGALHRAGVVVGDLNDLNVLVAGTRAHIIDADSFQFGSYRCEMYTERFVDPLLCDPAASAPQLSRPHNPDSDWYAFAVMLMRSLLGVGPYGGVYRPADPARRVAQSARPLRRITIFDGEVLYPKPARPYRTLPDELIDYLRQVFEADCRGPFPPQLLDALRWTRCRACHTEHARLSCPACSASGAPKSRPAVAVRGGVTAEVLTAGAAEIRSRLAQTWRNQHRGFVIVGGTLYRESDNPLLGRERGGDVLGEQTRFWVGDHFGVGFYAAGHLQVGFVFATDRGGLNDQVQLPPLRGSLVAAHAAVGRDRAWLFFVEQVRGRLCARCVVVGRGGELLASAESTDPEHWTFAGATACAAGDYLFVATDEGIARVEVQGTGAAITREFPETEPFVDASTRLALHPRGLLAVGIEQVLLLTME